MVSKPAQPRWATKRNGRRPSKGEALARIAQQMGYELFPWQRQVADVALETVKGDYCYRTIGVGVGRQNGKSTLISARIAMEALEGKRRIVYTAQDRNMARLKWEEHVDLLMYSPLKNTIDRVVRANGSEHLVFKNGSNYGISTPNRKGGRGQSNDLVVIDEALTHDMDILGALQPTLATKKNGQLWIVSNAGDETSILLAHYRTMGHTHIDDKTTRLAWFEWCPKSDAFDYLDPKVWEQAIPSLGQEHGVTIEAVREAAMISDPAIFTREWLNVWPAQESVQVVPTDLWDQLENPAYTLNERIVLGVDITRERHKASIAASGQVRGITPVELIENREGTSWLMPRLIELAIKWKAPVVLDAGSAAGTLIPHLENAGIHVIPVGMREYARACGDFYDAVMGRTITHLGDPLMRNAILGSSRRPLGEAWAWSRQGITDVTPLVAATLARWGAVSTVEEKPKPRSQVF
ncbi:COG4626 Phage terminase-like protein, large subunit [uncultured Caudovirales phage]|uniref:COG4626 Phage terminase-like protein, large subunit n=1 Tax=uncultured Caudovirales phage TaxID=2100421 RepID=A0A6J5QP52_9CAUD|nr:COG4626 Phage terminase-like protein, large subunit [uncultured Caudovirales phage]CAB4186190.1 COG4626 Phage terminase-like protein, large subunit [uncultured Caudovirales phage]CAB4192501.1 COG4626 Phage terminase-like protein, large subunit [uncultured Caudovirales phage]CAB4216985.1 COG4626 Phage terminase-like protein, large subunit [uncultured Caudovirales phage]CAB5231149.1 COG4626 Phage terminase-like protein, large subunit [uncultured Caudovirales phage]